MMYGGQNASTYAPLKRIEVFDFRKNTWTRKADMPYGSSTNEGVVIKNANGDSIFILPSGKC